MTSAYPIAVDELTDRVREQASRAGQWPSRRQVMTQFRVGRPKAAAALDALRATGFNPSPVPTPGAKPAHGPESSTGSGRPVPLHLVDDHETQPATPQNADAVANPIESGGPAGIKAAAPVDQAVARVPVMSSPASGVVDAPTTTPDESVPERVPVASRWGSWPLVLIALGAFVSIWGGWVGLGELTGFGPIRLLPGIADDVVINSAITLPIGVEAYAAFALRAWLAPAAGLSNTARWFARWSAIGALALGAAGQIAYHLMVAAGITAAPWPITAFVSCLPVVVLGCGAALTHLVHQSHQPGEGTR
jgi:hypothetical protein